MHLYFASTKNNVWFFSNIISGSKCDKLNLLNGF